MGRNTRLQKTVPYLMIFLFCMVFMVVISYINDGWIFGDYSFLYGDAGSQYIYFMYALWDKVHSGGSLFYSATATLGMDFYTNGVYYLSSIFNIIVLVFPRESVDYVVQFIMMVKWALCSVTMTYYFYHTSHNKVTKYRMLMSVLAGLFYGFSSYFIAYMLCYIWFDVFLVFPLLLLSFEHMIEDRRWLPYYLLLTFCIVSNFYTTFIVCVFLILFFFNQHYVSVKQMLQKGIQFVFVSVLAALSGGVIIIPCVLMAFGRYANNAGSSITWDECVCNWKEFVDGLYCLKVSTFMVDNTPYLYCGMFLMLTVLLYCFLPIKRKQKIIRLLTMLIFILSFFVIALNFVWHGGSIPHGYIYRFTFIVVFWAIYMWVEAFPYLKQLRVRYILLCGILVLGMYVISFFSEESYMDFYVYLSTFMLVVFYSIILIFYRRKSLNYKQFIITVFVCTCLELVSNAAFGLYGRVELNVASKDNNMDAYNLAKQVDSSENQNFAYEGLDADVGMWFHRTSINGYTSFVNGRLTELLYNMGLCNYSNDAYINYLGGSPVTNIIFNIKYAVGRYETGFSDVETVTQENDMYLYEMKHNLGTAYMVDSDVLEWESGGNVFEQQNRLVKAMTQADDVFLPLQDEVKCYTLEGECEKSEENVYSYKLLNEYDNVSISYEVSKDADLYMYLNNTLYGQCNVYVDDELVFRSKDLCKQQMVHIGKVQKGQRIRVTPVNHYKAGKEGEISCDMAEFNEEAFEKFYSELQDEQLTVEQYEEGNIQGSINVKQDGVLMTSIPALKGWTVYVDGVKMEYESVMDQALIALPLEGGKHTIEFRYVTPYFTVSLLVTCIGVIFTVLYWVVGKRKRGSI